MTSLFLGIDTGGTFTDGVLLDHERHEIVKSAKVLTTHHDLKICISQILDRLLDRSLDGDNGTESIRLVSLSTTLATNAIVEGKSRPVGLFLLGYDAELVYKFDFQKQFGTSHFHFIPGGMDLDGQEQAPLDEAALAKKVSELQGQVEAFAVSSYAGTLNASHEERAGELIGRISGLPVVEGHHLTSRLNSIRRATTASLNAGLLSTATDFLHTVEQMLAQRGVACPILIVKGDGSLVSAGFAERRPVEIIHSGPATSAIGGLYLAQTGSALVADVGGTTTDLALLQDGRVLQDGGDATVGPYPTSVRTIRARSFGLGGDSQIRFDPRGRMTIGPERVIPISYLAHTYPEVRDDLIEYLSSAPEKFYSERIEYWLLRREPRRPFDDPRTNRVIELLRGGPKRTAWLLKQAGARTAVQVDGERLTRQDIISRAGLTPTDLLHVTGEYTPWDAGAARCLVEAVARMWEMSVEDFVGLVRRRMGRIITAEIVRFLSGQAVPEEETGPDSLGRWMFDQALSKSDPLMNCQLRLNIPIIGIGAPARAFLPPVADALGTQIIFPEHYEVANAVGTVVGNVLVQKEGEVLPLVEGQVVTGYLARAGSSQQRFDTAKAALAYARATLRELTYQEAAAAGAENAEVDLREEALLGEMFTLKASAAGKPGLNGNL